MMRFNKEWFDGFCIGDKKRLLPVLALLSPMMGWTATVQAAGEYAFLGLYEPRKAGVEFPICRDYRMEHFPLKDRAAYSEAARSFREQHKGESPSPYLLEPDKAAIVYRYRAYVSGYGCEKEALGVATGVGVEEARKQIAERVAKNRKSYRSEPEIVLTWKGGEYKRTIRRNYDGLEITYTAYDTGSGARLTAQGINTRADKAAVFVFLIDGKQGRPMTVPPGGKFNHNFGKVPPGFVEVYVQYRQPQEDAASVIDLGKEFIRGKIGTKDGRLKGMDTPHADGKRG